MRRLLPVVALGLMAGDGVACRTRPLALGEALLVVDTDAAIPKHVGRLRVDVMREDRSLIESRDIIALRPEDWPVSFSVTADEEDLRTAIVRLRAYPQGHVVTRAEAALDGGSEPRYATSIDDACANAPALALGQPVSVKRGRDPITVTLPYVTGDADAGDAGDGGDAGSRVETRCGDVSVAGSYVAKLEITEPGPYRVEILGSIPAPTEPGGSITLSLRTECGVATTQTICNDDRPAAIETSLSAGTYYVVTGGAEKGFADFDIVARKVDQPLSISPPTPIPSDADVTDPAAGVTIDRLVRLQLVQGYRGTVPIVLTGECFGTASDLAGLRTCVDRSNVLVPVDTIVADGSLDRNQVRPPAWSGETPELCTLPPRAPSALLDADICVPGGAFVLGDLLALTDLTRRTRPERMRVVAPFFLDTYEFTVGRYRDALARGFAPSVVANDDTIDPSSAIRACTFSTKPIGREEFPLNCLTFETARALCRFVGADLPTEDQWEYAATATDTTSDHEQQYPWGEGAPTCDRAVVERGGDTTSCNDRGYGPIAVTDAKYAAKGNDISPLGVVGLAGNLQEWLVTGFYAYDHAAWRAAGLRAPISEDENVSAPLRATRGGDWAGFALYATGSARRFEPPLGAYTNVGFRCARPGR